MTPRLGSGVGPAAGPALGGASGLAAGGASAGTPAFTGPTALAGGFGAGLNMPAAVHGAGSAVRPLQVTAAVDNRPIFSATQEPDTP